MASKELSIKLEQDMDRSSTEHTMDQLSQEDVSGDSDGFSVASLSDCQKQEPTLNLNSQTTDDTELGISATVSLSGDSSSRLLSNGTNASEENESSVSESPMDTQPDEDKALRPVYKMDAGSVPSRITGCWSEFKDDNFTKGCKWSPDGLCMLTNSDDNCLRIFNLPDAFYENESGCDWSSLEKELTPILKMKEGETVYDFCWYPLMTSTNPITCCFVTTSRKSPIHMWDAFTGELRCSYKAHDSMDELTAALSLTFNTQGDRLLCGFDKAIRIFDVRSPGKCCQERLTKAMGQSGIISCIAVNPADTKMYAAGSYLKSIGIYSEPEGIQVFRLEGQANGVTHLMFSQDGNKLYSGGRKDPEILCWDVRDPGKILYSMQRTVLTNQRIYFDIDNNYIVSGNNDGCCTVWDTTLVPSDSSPDKEIVLDPVLSFQAHNDCVNGVSFNPLLPIIATSSGQRKFRELIEDEDSDVLFAPVNVRDNSVQLWWAGEQPK